MNVALRIDPEPKLLVADAEGGLEHLPRAALASLFEPGDVVVANDAATLPASLEGRHLASGAEIEARLAAWVNFRDPMRFVALAFGAGDHRMRTEDRPPPPPMRTGDLIAFGPLQASVEAILGHPRLVRIRFSGDRACVIRDLARCGRPVQYAHVPEPLRLWNVWTSIAAEPIAFEPPSAGFALDWRTLARWRARGVGFASLSHAAGLSSTGDTGLDARLPLDEFYRVPAACAAAIDEAKATGRRVVAIGTSVVRALEAAADFDGRVREGEGVACGRIARGSTLRVVDAVLTGVHQPGESHFELLRAFADERALERIVAAAAERGYRGHEFGDSILVARRANGSACGVSKTRRGR